jgi:hypothetical protein
MIETYKIETYKIDFSQALLNGLGKAITDKPKDLVDSLISSINNTVVKGEKLDVDYLKQLTYNINTSTINVTRAMFIAINIVEVYKSDKDDVIVGSNLMGKLRHYLSVNPSNVLLAINEVNYLERLIKELDATDNFKEQLLDSIYKREIISQ